MEQTLSEGGGLFPSRVGERLAEARRAKGIDLGEIAGVTRVPLRALEAIERGDHAALPAATYAIGFVRAYAVAIGLDPAAIARDFRAELGKTPSQPVTLPSEPADPARVPSRAMAMIALFVAILIAAGYAVWRTGLLTGYSAEDRARTAAGLDPSPPPVAAHAVPSATVPATSAAPGPVVVTAIEPVWLRIYDGKGGPRLIEKQMAAGESFTVPASAADPMILTGRPQSIRVAVGASVIPPLGSAERTISDVSLKPEALLARLAPPPAAPGPAASAAP